METPAPPKTRRQEHGIKAAPISLTVPGAMRARLVRDAQARRISISRHVVNLIAFAWSVQDALPPARGEESEAA